MNFSRFNNFIIIIIHYFSTEILVSRSRVLNCACWQLTEHTPVHARWIKS